MKTATDMGLRIERLLYFWLFLVFLNLLVAYLATAASYMLDSNNRAIDELLKLVEVNKTELQARFDRESSLPEAESERDIRIAKQRSLLKLPPMTAQERGEPGKGYRELLQEIVTPISIEHRLALETKRVFDLSSPPDRIIKDLRELSETTRKKSASILGIETPSFLSFQYGATDFKISAPYLAIALLASSLPLSMVWLGSFYITRQRELLLIRRARDHKSTFPHILNWLVLQLNNIEYGFDDKADVTKKQKLVALKFAKISTTIFRCFIALSICALIFVPATYSSLTLSFAISLPILILCAGVVFLSIIFFLSLSIIANEVMLLKGKVFYE